MATGNVLEHFSSSNFESVLVVMWFVPMVVSSGGNAGSQSATLIIRAMAIGRVTPRDGGRVLRRELVVSLALGGIIGVVGVARALATSETRSLEFCATIFTSLTAVILLGSVLGAGVPLVLRRLGIDPAVSSTPFIASLVDVTGLLIYFQIARLFLP